MALRHACRLQHRRGLRRRVPLAVEGHAMKLRTLGAIVYWCGVAALVWAAGPTVAVAVVVMIIGSTLWNGTL